MYIDCQLCSFPPSNYFIPLFLIVISDYSFAYEAVSPHIVNTIIIVILVSHSQCYQEITNIMRFTEFREVIISGFKQLKNPESA